MKKITKAVLPVAGLGTRFLPATKAQPKEMFPIVDKPVIQYLVEEAVASGIEEIIIVSSNTKRSIEDHFDQSLDLEEQLKKKEKYDLIEVIKSVSNLAKIYFTRQLDPHGDGHAVLCAKDFLQGDPFAVLFGDDIVDNSKPALKQLIEIYEQTGCSTIALEEINPEDSINYGMVKPVEFNGHFGEIVSFVEKPKPADSPSNLGIIGKYVVTPEILDALEDAESSHGGEIRLIDGFIKLRATQKIYGCKVEGKRFDTGDKAGLITANIHFGLKHPAIAEGIKEYLKTLVD